MAIVLFQQQSSIDRRRHGFQWPLNPLQVLSWVVFSSDVAIFAALCLSESVDDPAASMVVYFWFSASALFLLAAAFCATVIDPSVTQSKADMEAYYKTIRCWQHYNGGCEMGADCFFAHDEDELRSSPEAVEKFCGACRVVLRPRTKHCRDCDKCVQGFDHHCKWLNTCIGARNYKWFLCSIGSLASLTACILFYCCCLIARCVADGEDGDDRAFLHRQAFWASIFLVALNVPLLLLDVQLILLHVFLWWRGLTTYEYILLKIQWEQQKTRNQPSSRCPCQGGGTLPPCIDWIVYRRRKRHRGPEVGNSKAHSAEDIEAPAGCVGCSRKFKAGSIVPLGETCEKSTKVAAGAPNVVLDGGAFEPSGLVAISVPAPADAPIAPDATCSSTPP